MPKFKKFKWDILVNFQTLCSDTETYFLTSLGFLEFYFKKASKNRQKACFFFPRKCVPSKKNSQIMILKSNASNFSLTSKTKREFICFAENIFHRKIFSIVFDGKYFPPFLMENFSTIFRWEIVNRKEGVNY